MNRYAKINALSHWLRSFYDIARDPGQTWSGIYACRSNTSVRDTDTTIAPCGRKTLFHILDLSLCFLLQIASSVHAVVQCYDHFEASNALLD